MNDCIFRSAMLSELAKHCSKTADGRTLYHPLILSAMEDARRVPAVDAVAVVRCGMCKHWKEQEKACGLCGGRMLGLTRVSDFCSYGERRVGND